MDKDTFVKLLKSKEHSKIMYLYFLDTLPEKIVPEQLQTIMIHLSMYYGIPVQEMIQRVIIHYEKKFHIEVWRNTDGKIIMYNGEKV